MALGGRRPGAGRPKGSKDKKGARKARSERGKMAVQEVISDADLTSVQVMRKAMSIQVAKGEWDKAAAIAKDLAPYEYPKLSSAVVKADVQVETTQVVELLITTREQADQAIAALSAASGVPRQ